MKYFFLISIFILISFLKIENIQAIGCSGTLSIPATLSAVPNTTFSVLANGLSDCPTTTTIDFKYGTCPGTSCSNSIGNCQVGSDGTGCTAPLWAPNVNTTIYASATINGTVQTKSAPFTITTVAPKAVKTPLTGPKTQVDISFNSPTGNIYSIKGDLIISGDNTGSYTGVVFVENNLNITGDYTYGTATNGTVFVVKGNVYINPTTVTRVDAVIISSGTIYTAAVAGTTCTASSVTTVQPLTINGSLISLDPVKPIIFCRSLADNSQPAEKINHQVKYLVILRDLLSDTYQKWSEIP